MTIIYQNCDTFPSGGNGPEAEIIETFKSRVDSKQVSYSNKTEKPGFCWFFVLFCCFYFCFWCLGDFLPSFLFSSSHISKSLFSLTYPQIVSLCHYYFLHTSQDNSWVNGEPFLDSYDYKDDGDLEACHIHLCFTVTVFFILLLKIL